MLIYRIILSLCLSSVVQANSFELPDAATQKAIFHKLRDEMIRLDGEGLLARKGRSKSFVETTDEIMQEISNDNSIHDFINTFQRLTATYTNLHSRAVYRDDIQSTYSLPYRQQRSISLFAEVDQKNTKILINRINDPASSEVISKGDEVVAINGRAVSSWLEENFLFCKYTLRIQCDRELENNLQSLSLSWKGNSDLIYTVEHDEELVDVKIQFTPELVELLRHWDVMTNGRSVIPVFDSSMLDISLVYLKRKMTLQLLS